MDLDKWIKWATGTTVTVVGCIAAWLSYSHIYLVGHHNPLLPVSVDGMIVASSLVLLTASRAKLGTIALARVTLWLGIAATLAANVAYGWSEGLLGATIAVWPAVCFVLVVETVMQLAKARRVRTRSTPTPRTANVVTANREVPAKSVVSLPAKPEPTPTIRVNAVPRILDIREALSCGQPKATDIQRIIREQDVSIERAAEIREQVMTDARKH